MKTKLHIGCGDHPIPGWINTDLQPCMLGIGPMDVTKPFMFGDQVFDYVFSEHQIEHITKEQGAFMLSECFRVMKRGGCIRISCPGAENVASILQDNHPNYVSWAEKEFGLKGADQVAHNLAHGFGHQYIYSYRELTHMLSCAGFVDTTLCYISQSFDPELCGLENVDRMPEGFLAIETLTVEALKL